MFKFIAINGDDVGEKIGGAIASDNHEELSQITGNLKEAHAALEEWASSKGGEVITSAGDEAIFKIPAEGFDFDEVESLKDEYSNQSGHSATIGIGNSMSEASKALIYGKMNEKDQVVEYDSTIDDYISDYDEEDEDSTLDDEQEFKDDMDEAEDSQEDMDLDDNEDGQEDDTYEENSFESDEDEKTDLDADVEEDLSEEFEDSDESGKFEEESEYEESPLDGESPSEETEEELPDSEEENLMEEGEIGEEDFEDDSEGKLEDFTDEDTEEIDAPADHLDGDYGSEEMADAQPPHEQGMGEEEEFIHDAKENRDDELDSDSIEADMEASYGEEDHPNEEEDEYTDMAEEPQDKQSAVQDMIHANLDEEEDAPDAGASEELKQRIASTLVAFKENKIGNEQLRSQNPKAYQAQISMIENMIDMAKLLNMNPEQDAAKMESMGQMPGAEEEPEEEMVQKSENIRKARVDEGKSKAVKQKMRSKRNKNFGYSRDHSEKGVHRSDYARVGSQGGESEAGNRATGFGDIDNKSGRQKAKESHLKVISEQRRSKKPNLPKSEDLELKKKVLKKGITPKDPKSLPDKATKHTPRKRLPVGATKKGKVKVRDGETGKVSWRSGRKGMKKDWDGEPTTKDYNRADAKERKTHTVHMGRRAKK